MEVKFEYISTKKPKYHIYHTNNYMGNGITNNYMGNGIITFKNNETGKQFQYTDEIQYDYSSYNDYVNFSEKVWNYLNTDKENMPFSEEEIKIINSKILDKREEIINFFKKNTATSSINHSEALHEEFKVKSVGAEPSVYRHSDTLPMGEAGKGESGISPLQDNIDTFKLEAEHQAATAIVEANMAEFHAERAELKEKEQQEREALIAEASRLTGRVEALDFISKLTTVSGLMLLKNIKENKIYKELPNIKTWEEYCKSIGFSRQKVDLDLDNLKTFGEEFLTTVSTFGLGYRELRSLSKQVKAGNLEVKDAEVIIDGEVIPLDDKDELRDALDTLLKSKYKEIEEKDKLLKDKEMQLEVVRETKDGFARRMDKAEEEAVKYKKEIEKLKNNKPSFKNVSDVDAEDFQKLLNLEQQWRDLFNALRNATDDDKLSSFNKSMLGGIVAQILLMLDDFRMQLNGKSEFYFHGVEMDEEMLNKQVSPSDFLAMQNNK